ncbi:MAG: DevR family CRISPR-associated autoregulator [candidate division WOR-3 bacterium]|nr:DevR family CRISPR-associated autoregulator [candidate division WOR-3 bacterium]
MLKFVTFAVKLQLNVHDLNNEAVAGNVMDIRMIEFLNEAGEKQEAPAVSGRMLKHWHYEAMRSLILNGVYNVSLCDGCKAGEPIRPAKISSNKLQQISEKESKIIESCGICDIHGYLIAKKQGKSEARDELGEGDNSSENEAPDNDGKDKSKKRNQTKSKADEQGISARRSSRAMFSWLMPVLGVASTVKQVIHSRVSQQRSEAEENASQMIFSKSYASGIYAFVSALDVERIGRVDLALEGNANKYQRDVVKSGQRINRIKAALEAYRLMLSGQIGASLSHALPHCTPTEVLVVCSEEGPLPFPVSPMYSDYIAKTAGLMPAAERSKIFLYSGNKKYPDGVEKKEKIDEIFEELANMVKSDGTGAGI